jgi:hypothetical protein
LAAGYSFKNTSRAILTWFSLPNTNIRPIRILIALWAIVSGMLVWQATSVARETVQLSPVRFGDFLVELPIPARDLDILLFSIYYLSCIGLISPFLTRTFASICALFLTYYCLLDISCTPHPILLTDIFLIALLFAGKEDNATRRIIQVETSLCYAFAVWHKVIFADFFEGYSLKAWMGDGRVLNHFFAGLAQHLHFPIWAWGLFSLLTILTESFFAVGVWFKPLRKITVITASLFHLVIFFMFPDYIMFYSCLMWTGLLAFVGKDSSWWQEEKDAQARFRDERSGIEKPFNINRNALAFAFVLLMFAIPARLFYWPGRSNEELSALDRAPLTFAMFVEQDQTVKAKVYFQGADGHWYSEQVKTRLRILSSDNHLYAVANAFMRRNLDVKHLKVAISYVANERRLENKVLTIDRENGSERQSLRVTYVPLQTIDLVQAGLVKH